MNRQITFHLRTHFMLYNSKYSFFLPPKLWKIDKNGLERSNLHLSSITLLF